ncbi:MAG: class I SAM-dependent methyltransferase [Pseudohaliea sp.]
MADRCPACSGDDLRDFYRVAALPVHSTRLMASRDEALTFPRRPLQLALCHRCGFIFNRAFDPSVHRYSARCEESQGRSPTFSAWLAGLVERLVTAHGVCGQRVLEIGCGKGEFLAALCSRGDNVGIGYDPTFVPGRAGDGEGERWQVEPALWEGARGIHAADVIACRHTLEHIGPVRDFLEELRKAIGKASPLLFFEVPDTARILGEGAFWDVYYEHCSYFTLASLDGLFRRAGFAPVDLWLDYDDQYLLMLARPVAAAGAVPEAAGSRHIQAPVEVFSERVEEHRARWSAFLARCRAARERVVLWGGGSKASAFLCVIDGAGYVAGVVDIDPYKQGAFVAGAGQPVMAPEALRAAPPDHVILMNPVYEAEVRARLSALGLTPAIHPLGRP